jgi:hypothetical protein
MKPLVKYRPNDWRVGFIAPKNPGPCHLAAEPKSPHPPCHPEEAEFCANERSPPDEGPMHRWEALEATGWPSL